MSYTSIFFVVLLVFSCFVSVFSGGGGGVSVFVSAVEPDVIVSTESELCSVVNAAPTDGSSYVVALTANIPFDSAVSTGEGTYDQGATVTVNAGTRNGYTFSGWTVSGDVALINSVVTSFIMPLGDVIVTADWTFDSSNDNNGSNSGSSGGSNSKLSNPPSSSLGSSAPAPSGNVPSSSAGKGDLTELLRVIAALAVIVAILIVAAHPRWRLRWTWRLY